MSDKNYCFNHEDEKTELIFADLLCHIINSFTGA